MKRKPETIKKLDRILKALKHEEPDRIPISDFFWGSFLRRWRSELGLRSDEYPYFYYDLDMIVTNPNLDPHIKQFEILKQDEKEVIVKTGFEATVRKKFDFPMPEQVDWDTNSIEKLLSFEFDDPRDPRRYYEGGDNHISGVGDGFYRNTPAWVGTMKDLYPEIPVFGSVIECSECLTRLIGQMNNLLWIGMYADELGRAINRIGEFYLEICKAQIEAAEGFIDGMVIWGDVAYKQSTFFDPDYWRMYYKPWVKAMVDHCHLKGLPVMYHGCGNVKLIFNDFIEMKVDVYNPLEAKAGLDVVELRKEYGHKIAFCGNSDITVWETNNLEEVKKEVLRKMNAGKGGGYIFQSDHSVSSSVSGKTYDYIVKLVREYGNYPLKLGAYDEQIS